MTGREIPAFLTLLWVSAQALAVEPDCAAIRQATAQHALAEFSVAWIDRDGEVASCTSSKVAGQGVFEAASLSKPVFAAMVVKLAAEGQLSLDAKLASLIEKSALPERFRALHDRPGFQSLTVRHVLTHTSGLPNWRGTAPLDFEAAPGERFTYSGEAFELLQSVVEHLTGSPLQALAEKEIFEPLQMGRTSYLSSDLPPLAGTHSIGIPLPPTRSHVASAAHSLVTTAPDYMKFLRGLVSGRIVDREALLEMATPQSTERDNEHAIRWGLGIMVQPLDTISILAHTGSNPGFRSLTLVGTNGRTGLVYLSNAELGSVLDQPLVRGLTTLPPSSELYAWLDCARCAERSRFIRDANAGHSELAFDQLSFDELTEIGYAYAEFGVEAQARRIYAWLAAQRPEDVEPTYGLAILALRLGQFEAARRLLQRVLAANPSADNARKILDGIDGMDQDEGVRCFLPGHPDAKAVFLRGDFNGWHRFSLPMKRVAGGWERHVTLDDPGSRYVYMVDNDWTPDPRSTSTASFFGKPVSVMKNRGNAPSPPSDKEARSSGRPTRKQPKS